MNKNALRFLVASALLSPATLYALGLGEIRLNSALNQPFDADIEVVSASADELSSLKVALASEDMFRRYGLDRPNFLSNFSVRVDSANAGRPIIKLRSPNAVTEPFLSLLVEVSWTGGRVLREYTVLLDPPVFAPAASQQQVLTPRGGVETPAVGSGTIERTPAPAAAPAAPASPAPSAPARAATPAATAAGDSYTVKPADTLSKIAKAIGNGRVTDRQTMVALYRANPQAFDGNVNLLRSGSILRIPASAEIEAISNAEAAAELSRQYGAWRATQGTSGGAAENTERLRLVPPAQGGAGSAQTPAGGTATNGQVQSLQAQLAEARRLLDLRNAELAQMQQRLAGATGMAAETPPATANTSSSSVAAEPAPEVEAATPAVAAEPPVDQEAASSVSSAAPVAAPTPAPAAAEPGLFERISQYGLWLIIAGLVLIVALIAYFRRRQQLADEDSGATLTAGDFEDHISRSSTRLRAMDEVEPDLDTEQAFDAGATHAPTFAAESLPEMSEDTLSSETAIHVDQQDALAEADFHMAYGLYDQAADIVKLAVERQPERRDLKLKLAEIYFVWGNRDAFLETARQLHDTQDQATPGEWDKVLIMGKQICPDESLFAGSISGSGAADNVDVNLEGGEHHVDINLYDAPSGDQPKSNVDFELAATGARIGGVDSGLDFLLDEPQRGVDDEPTREVDTARTQEMPTIESPFLNDPGSATIAEKFDQGRFDRNELNIDQTAELSLDEIGLDVSELEKTGTVDDDEGHPIGDDELTRLASSLDRNFDPTSETKTMLAPHMDDLMEGDSELSGNTITVEEVDFGGDTIEQARPSVDSTGFTATQKVDEDSFDLSSGDTAEQPRPGTSETGIFRATQKIDMDLDYLSNSHAADEGDTLKSEGRGETETDLFSEEVFGGALGGEETEADRGLHDTNVTEVNAPEFASGEFELPEMEPATMSEVGTKLDLARAYMDMGDPDGARSILQEVLEEGSGSQKQEAQRLLDSIG
ncbi:MAG: FimV/HubP family polar landmark protein [Steroidobacteraceae bacterium]